MLDVRRLRVLKEVADQGSFSAAADALSYTQSAVSQQIAALEREAGAQLVQRGARGIRLTEAGEALVAHSEAIIGRIAGDPQGLGGAMHLAACELAGFEPHVAFQSDDYNVVQGLVAAGVAISLIPELALTNLRDDIVIRPLPKRETPVRGVVAATLA